MARDERIRMRNALVIPGALLVFYGVLAIVYAEAFRARSDFCADSNRILIAGLCYSVRNLIIPLVVIGVALIVTGLIVFKGRPAKPEDHLRHGTPTHVLFAILVSWVSIAAVTWLVQFIRQAGGEPFELTVLGGRYQHTFLLELLLLVGLLALVPYLTLYLGIGMRQRAFAEAVEAEEAGPVAAPSLESFAYADTTHASEAQADDMLADEDWPAERDTPVPAAVPAAGASAASVLCQAKVAGQGCVHAVVPGARFCETHGCKRLTKEGKACRNQSTADGLCQIHALVERQA